MVDLMRLLKKLRSAFFLISSPFLRIFELPFLAWYGRGEACFQPVFIIGAPRTGSTILYQSITNSIDVVYIDNLASLFFRNIFFGVGLSRIIFRGRAHNNFLADHGDTSAYGLDAPSECGEFWYRWIPKGQHYVPPSQVSEQAVNGIRREISALINFYKKPVVINNNNVGLRLALVLRAFPDAKVIVTDREPFYVAQSLLKARARFYGDVSYWWSMKPEDYLDIIQLSPIEQVVRQHYSIRKSIIKGLVGRQGKTLWVDYRRLADFVEPEMRLASDFIGYKVVRSCLLPAIKLSEKEAISEFEADLVRLSIKGLEWDDHQG